MSAIKPSPDGYTCTECGDSWTLAALKEESPFYHVCPKCPRCLHAFHKPGQCTTPSVDGCRECGVTEPLQAATPRPTTRQAALMRLATEVETLAEKAGELHRELAAAGAPVLMRSRVRQALSAVTSIMDDLMVMAREDDRG